MDVTNAVNIAIPFTAGFESFRALPYWDTNSYAIGYGNHYYSDGSAVSADDDPIDEPTARWLLGFTLTGVASAIAPMLQVPVTNSMLAALADLGYNWGTGNVQKSILLQLINSGASSDQVNTQWQKTAITSGGNPNSDLVTRRAAEVGLSMSGDTGIGSAALVLAGLFIASFIIFSIKGKR